MHATCIEDLRTIARRRLPRWVFDYVDGGAEDEVSLRENRAALERILFRPRTLVDVATRDLVTTLFDRPLAVPFVVGPTGLAGVCWPRADLELARAAASAGAVFALSTGASELIEEVGRVAGGRLWLQAYVFRERRITESLMRRAADAGFEAVVITSDSAVVGKRQRDWRAGLLPAKRLRPGVALEMLLHPRWLVGMAVRPPIFRNLARELPPGESPAAFLGREMYDPALDWDGLARLRDGWRGRMLLKGVLRADDAERAVALGVDGIVVSNHGGRQLDGAIAAIEALPAIVQAVGGRTTIVVDGGVRRGSDVVKALALGASAALLGRAPLYGVAAAGRAGAERALEILRDELDRTLALTGCRTLADLTPDLLASAPR